eukprot:1162010-Pelagomonas_calceolata.AAC.12
MPEMESKGGNRRPGKTMRSLSTWTFSWCVLHWLESLSSACCYICGSAHSTFKAKDKASTSPHLQHARRCSIEGLGYAYHEKETLCMHMLQHTGSGLLLIGSKPSGGAVKGHGYATKK